MAGLELDPVKTENVQGRATSLISTSHFFCYLVGVVLVSMSEKYQRVLVTKCP